MEERKFKSQYHKNLWEQAEKRREEARKMRESGKTWGEIGKALGVSQQRALQLGK